MVPVPAQILLGLASGYMMASLSESFLHRRVGHAKGARRRRWQARPRLYGYLIRAYFRHAVVHHGLTFRVDHVTQFEDARHKAEVDDRLRRAGDRTIEGHGYGLRPGWIGLITYNLTTAPALILLGWVTGAWAALAAAPLLAVTPLLSHWIHPYLHRDHASAVRESPRWVALLLRTRYFRAVARHHFLHHKYPNSNFNLLLGGDWLFGVHRKATAADLAEMERIGLRID